MSAPPRHDGPVPCGRPHAPGEGRHPYMVEVRDHLPAGGYRIVARSCPGRVPPPPEDTRPLVDRPEAPAFVTETVIGDPALAVPRPVPRSVLNDERSRAVEARARQLAAALSSLDDAREHALARPGVQHEPPRSARIAVCHVAVERASRALLRALT